VTGQGKRPESPSWWIFNGLLMLFVMAAGLVAGLLSYLPLIPRYIGYGVFGLAGVILFVNIMFSHFMKDD